MKTIAELMAIPRPKKSIQTHRIFFVPCQKCAGRGVIESYRHRDNGKCWECGGTGKFQKIEAIG